MLYLPSLWDDKIGTRFFQGVAFINRLWEEYHDMCWAWNLKAMSFQDYLEMLNIEERDFNA